MTGSAFEPSSLFSNLDEEWQAIVAAATAEFDRGFDENQLPSMEEALNRFDVDHRAPEFVRPALVAEFLSIEAHRRFKKKSGFLPSRRQLLAAHPKLRDIIEAVFSLMSIEDRLPEQIGEYFPQEQISRGGQASVVTASNPEMRGRIVVVKYAELKSPHAQLILNEGRILDHLSAVCHPSIIQLRHFGSDSRYSYVVLPYLRGETLEEAGRLSAEAVVDIGYQLADALAVAHSCDCLHNDVKPENIRLLPATAGKHPTPVLMDFGLGVLNPSGNWRKPKVRSPGGTSGFEASEQMTTERMVDGRTDVFQLGVTLGWSLTGHNVREPAVFADSVRQLDISPALRDCILKATASDPEQRFQSARAMSDCLLDQLPKPDIPTNTRPSNLLLIALTFVGLAAAVIVFGPFNNRAPRNEIANDARPASTQTKVRSDSTPEDAPSTMSLPDAQLVLSQLMETRDGSNKGQRLAIPALISLGCDFVNSDLTGVSFAGVDLSNGDLTSARLQVCDFNNAVAKNATISGVRLDASSFDRCEFSDCDLSMTRGMLLEATDSQFIDCDFSRANLAFSNLSGTDFTGADLSGACLSYCNLTGATFRGANLTGAYLNGSVLCGTDFTNATVSDTSFFASVVDDSHMLTAKQLAGAVLRLPSPVPGIQITEFWSSSRFATGREFSESPSQRLSLPDTDQAPDLPVYEHPQKLPVRYDTSRNIVQLSRVALRCGSRHRDIYDRIDRNQEFLQSQFLTRRFLQGDGSWKSRCVQRIKEAVPEPYGEPFIGIQLLVLSAFKQGLDESSVNWQEFLKSCRDVETARTPQQFNDGATADSSYWKPVFPARLLSPLPAGCVDPFRHSMRQRIETVPNELKIRLPAMCLKGEAIAVFKDGMDKDSRSQRARITWVFNKHRSGYLDAETNQTELNFINALTREYTDTTRAVSLSLKFPGDELRPEVYFVFPKSFSEYCVNLDTPYSNARSIWVEAELSLSITGFKLLDNRCVFEVLPKQVLLNARGEKIVDGKVVILNSPDGATDAPSKH